MNTVRDLFLSGKSFEATEIRNSLFRENEPELYSKIEMERSKLFQNSEYVNIVDSLNSVVNDSDFRLSTEWRIKSPASILDSLNSPRENETTIDAIRDLLGYRFWIDCRNFSEFPERMLSLTSLILAKVGEICNLDYIRLSDSTDHPYQRVSLHYKIESIPIEILVMNQMFQSAFNRTLYPMWEGHTKGRFDVTDIPFPFGENERDYLWGIVCHALHNQSATLPFDSLCECKDNCKFRMQFQDVDFDDIRERMEMMATQYGGDFVFG